MTDPSGSFSVTGVAIASTRSVIGYEILRRVEPAEVPGYRIDPHNERAVLGAPGGRYLVPPGIDLFELGLIDAAGRYELLPIDDGDKPLWDEVTHLLVTARQADQQRRLLLRSYRMLHAMIAEADELEASVIAWSRRREAHPTFGMLRLETIQVWRTMRSGIESRSERKLDGLRRHVARRVAIQIGAHIIR